MDDVGREGGLLPLTPMDLVELERMLTGTGMATEEDLEEAREQSEGLGLFIRGLVGLERDAATAALNTFVAGRASPPASSTSCSWSSQNSPHTAP